jgi:hypothetical protein
MFYTRTDYVVHACPHDFPAMLSAIRNVCVGMALIWTLYGFMTTSVLPVGNFFLFFGFVD